MKVKKKKVQIKKKQVSRKLLWFFVLIPALLLTVVALQSPQIVKQEAATSGITTCGGSGEPGNEKGVGKACTKGGGECGGDAPFCSADFVDGPGVCSKPCSNNNECGTGAKCVQQSLGKGCEPVVCAEEAQPTDFVPSAQCLGTSCEENDAEEEEGDSEDTETDNEATDSAEEDPDENGDNQNNDEENDNQGDNDGGGNEDAKGLFFRILELISQLLELFIGWLQK
ncbi:MAG: hypothetical protein AAB553_03630 [Patescibacteria group bacterium]